MSKRLQVVIDEKELREIERAARNHKLTVSEWVRQTLRAARQRQPAGDPTKKLQFIRAAVANSFPTADIDQMLREIEAGYGLADE